MASRSGESVQSVPRQGEGARPALVCGGSDVSVMGERRCMMDCRKKSRWC